MVCLVMLCLYMSVVLINVLLLKAFGLLDWTALYDKILYQYMKNFHGHISICRIEKGVLLFS